MVLPPGSVVPCLAVLKRYLNATPKQVQKLVGQAGAPPVAPLSKPAYYLSRNQFGRSMAQRTREEFHKEAQAAWQEAISKVVGPVPAMSQTWNVLPDMQRVLTPFMGQGRNHAHYPSGGGMDFVSVAPSREQGCLEFLVEERMADVMRPSALTLEHFPETPVESFLFLDLAATAPSGVYESVGGMSEELVELRPGRYVQRGVWDDGFNGHDEHGRELPLPPEARLVTRWLSGSIMFVSKGSLWNNAPRTYDGGIHNTVGRHKVRHMIQEALDKR